LNEQNTTGTQTDALISLDLLEYSGINPVELYKFDRKTEKLMKYEVERDQFSDTVKVSEYANKYGVMNHFYRVASLDCKNEEELALFDRARQIRYEVEQGNKNLSTLIARINEV
jgi:hypothetical protein